MPSRNFLTGTALEIETTKNVTHFFRLPTRPRCGCWMKQAEGRLPAGLRCSRDSRSRPANPWLADSKELTPETRERLAEESGNAPIGFAVAYATVAEIDSINIFHASMLAPCARAVEMLEACEFALIDGNARPPISIPCHAGRRR